MKRSTFMLVGAMLVACVSMFVSCGNAEKKTEKIGDCELVFKGEKVGLVFAGNTVLYEEYDNISLDEEHGVFIASKGEEKTLLDAKTRTTLLTDNVTAIDPAEEAGFFYVKSARGVWLYTGGSTWGPFPGIKVQGNYVFFNDDNGKWGAALINPKQGLAPRNFKQVFVVENAKTKKFGVLVNDGKNWMLYDAGGVSEGQRFDIPPAKLAKEVAKLKLDGDVGVAEVGWEL